MYGVRNAKLKTPQNSLCDLSFQIFFEIEQSISVGLSLASNASDAMSCFCYDPEDASASVRLMYT